MVRIPPIPAPDIAALDQAEQRQRGEPLLSVEIDVVTPMFGGGAEPRRVDPHNPIRPSAVRGQLRFWWRACHAARFATAAELFNAEAAIWGAIAGGKDVEGPSAVDVRVEILDPGSPLSVPYNRTHPYPSYAVFPFEETRHIAPQRPGDRPRRYVTIPGGTALQDVRFRLTLAISANVGATSRPEAILEAATDATWAWITFGGVGARTRRGCGSLYCADSAFAPASDLASWLQISFGNHVENGPYRLQVPKLLGSIILLDGIGSQMPQAAWANAVQTMRDFRQGYDIGRKGPSQGGVANARPGRSYWPEPDTVREYSAAADARHMPDHPSLPYYPRADLGLPLIFQQMIPRAPGSRNDPPQPTLQGKERGWQRMASPVILKPLAVGRDKAVALALVLEAPHVWEAAGVQLLNIDRKPEDIDIDALRPSLESPVNKKRIAKSEAVAQALPHLNTTSARDAFVAYLSGRAGWRQVTP